MLDMKQMGGRIHQLRQKKELTQVALAEELGVTSQAISKWERGQSFPDVSRLDELAELLDVTVAYLLTGEE